MQWVNRLHARTAARTATQTTAYCQEKRGLYRRRSPPTTRARDPEQHRRRAAAAPENWRFAPAIVLPGRFAASISATPRRGHPQLKQPSQRLSIFVRGLGNDFGRQVRRRRRLVPRLLLEPIAHELLVEARRRGADLILIGRPEA